MAGESSTLPPALDDARQQAGRFWQARAPRERQLIVAMAVAVGALLVWLVLLQPALRVLHDAPLDLDRLDLQMQQMQLAAGEMQSLRAASPVPAEQAATALRAATAQLGDKAKLAVQGDRATITFTAIPAEALRGWLGEARSAARARPTEAQLVKAASGYSGSITVSLGGAS
ncbi:MAG: type II secretion system protein GspM [Caldimonas sp.]